MNYDKLTQLWLQNDRHIRNFIATYSFVATHEVEDFMNDSFIRAHRYFGAHPEKEYSKSWLFSVVRSELIDRLRSSKRLQITYRERDDLPDCEIFEQDNTIELLLKKAISLLNDSEKEIVSFYLRGINLRRAALERGKNEQYFRGKTHRLRKRMASIKEQLLSEIDN